MTYNFVCVNCSQEFEKSMTLLEYSQVTRVQCPNCNSRNTRRRYHIIPVHYVGKGFTKAVKPED